MSAQQASHQEHSSQSVILPVRILATTGAYLERCKLKIPGCSDDCSLSSMEMRVDSADSMYSVSSLGVPGPDDVSNLIADIAD